MSQRDLIRISHQPPSLWQRMRDRLSSVRSYTLGPFTPSNWPGPEAKVWGSSSAPSSGVVVTEETALNYAAVWSAVALIADDISSLPLMLYKRLANGGKQRFETHPIYRLLHDAPNPEMGSMVFRRTIQAHVMTWGGGYAEIERDTLRRPVALWPLTPDRVTVLRDMNGDLRYRVTNGANQVYLDPANMLHIPGLGFNGITGYSVIQKAQESLGLGVAAERFGGSFFGNGSTMGGVITYPNDPHETVKKSNRDALNQRHQGVHKAHQMLALYGGAKYERIGIPPNDAQFLETRVFQVREVARWFKLPPHKLGDLADATFSNVEQQNLDYYTSCLRPWLELWEQELERKLIAPLERSQQFIEHITEGFLRGDAQGRSDFYSKLFAVGGITINEMRSRENLDPVEGGDTPFVPLNMMPLNKIGAYVDAQIDKLKAPPPAPNPPAAPTPDPKPDETKTLFEDLERRMEDRARALTAEAERRVVAEAERDQMRAELAALFDKQAQAADVTQALLDLDCRMEERAAALKEEATKRATTEAALQVAREQLTTMQADRAELERTQALLEARIEQERAEKQSAVATAETHAQTTIEELRTQLTVVQAATNDLDARLSIAQKQQGIAETNATDAATREAVIAERLSVLTAERDALAQGSQNAVALTKRLLAPQRHVLIHAMQCVLQREADRARKAAGSPQRLRKWAAQFYEFHADFCREALRPSVRAWQALTGDARDLSEVLDGLIAAHITASQRQVEAVLDEADGDLAPALERVLHRWETDRAEATVDRFIGGSYE